MDNNKRTTKGMGRRYGESGTIIFSGHITAEEYNSRLVGKSAVRQYEIMRRSDSTVRSALQMCKLPLLGLDRRIEPASDSPQDEDIAAFVQRELFDRNVNFHDFARQALSFFDFGFSVFEKTFELTNYNGQTRVGIADLGYRKQVSIDRWETEDQKPGITQRLVHNTVSIPEEKLIIFTHDKEGDNYEGISLLRFAYKDWDIKDKLILVNAIALEKLAMGIPIVEFDSTVSENEKDRARELLRQIRANEEAYLEKPKGSVIEILDMKANSTKDVLPTIQYHDRQVLLSVLGQFLALGAADASGSRAVGDVHSKLFMLSEESANKILNNTIQEQLVKQLCDLNFSDMPNGYPKLVSGRVQDDDVATLADAYQKFSSAGLITPDPELEDHVRKQLHAPELPEELKKDYVKNAQTEKKKVEKSKKDLPDEDDEEDIDQKDIKASINKAKAYNNKLIGKLIDPVVS